MTRRTWSPFPVSDEGGGEEGGEPIDLPEQDLTVDVNVDSQWDAGYCATVTVTNDGAESVLWKFTLEVDGEITQIWNAILTPIGDELLVQGVDWNQNLEPDNSAQFGFCAAL